MKQWITYSKKIVCNGGMFAFILYITYRTVFSKIYFNHSLTAIPQLDVRFIIFGLLAALFMICAEAFNLKRNLFLLGEKKGYFKCLTYAFAGNFFSGITPGAVGGQPMQLYFMRQDKIPVSKGTLALLMDLGAYQMVTTSLGILGYGLCFSSIHRSLGNFAAILWIGIALNIVLFTVTFLAMFSKKFSYSLVAFATKIITFFHKKKGQAFQGKAMKGIQQYQTSAMLLKENWGTFRWNFFITLLRVIAMHSAPFWIYKAFGLSSVGFFEILGLQSALYISCAALPFPGGAGIGESAYFLYFKEIFPSGVIGLATMLSRGVGFYSVLLFCGASLLLLWIVKQLKNKNIEKIINIDIKHKSFVSIK